jgi:hypothetical protein
MQADKYPRRVLRSKSLCPAGFTLALVHELPPRRDEAQSAAALAGHVALDRRDQARGPWPVGQDRLALSAPLAGLAGVGGGASSMRALGTAPTVNFIIRDVLLYF